MIFSKSSPFRQRRFGNCALLSWVLVACMYMCAVVQAKEDPVDLIRRHRYEEAIDSWQKDLEGGKIGEKELRALKGCSLAYYRLGSLYEVYSSFSASIMTGYYGDQIGETGSALHYLYLGQIQYQGGKFAQAKVSFERAKKMAGKNAAIQEMADVFTFFARKNLNEVTGDFPGVLKDNAAQWEAMELKGMAVAEATVGKTATTQRARRCRLKLLLLANPQSITDIDAALKAVLADAQQPETYLDQGKNSQINFYDPFLMETISKSYYALGLLTNIKIKSEEKNFSELAGKFNTNLAMAEASAKLGDWKSAATYLPQTTDLETQLLKVQILSHQGKGADAKTLLVSLSESSKSASDKRDIADCYYLLGSDFDKGIKLAAQAIRDKNGPNYYRTYANLLMVTGQIETAMQQYAKGYKIEYRNRIDQIDPEYMCDYAFAIFKTNKLRYEEVVETLYHLQKEFPACRQMHYCMQGLSAGLARSYESQRIFRKGG